MITYGKLIFRACSDTVQLPENPSIPLLVQTPASRWEQRSFGNTPRFSWASSPISPGRPARDGEFQPIFVDPLFGRGKEEVEERRPELVLDEQARDVEAGGGSPAGGGESEGPASIWMQGAARTAQAGCRRGAAQGSGR